MYAYFINENSSYNIIFYSFNQNDKIFVSKWIK